MEAAIITIGDELLYGQTVDTNSAWMGSHLADIGIHVAQILSVSDDAEAIVRALDQSASVADLVLITGGLGPTKDDITRETLARYFDSELVVNDEIMQVLETYFQKRGIPILETHRKQARLPAACTPLRNNNGTAWGMWFEKDNKVFVSMPGVPHEMKGLMTEEVLPHIQEQFALPVIVHKHILTAGVGETHLAGKIEDIEDALPKHIKLAYLPAMGFVKLRLTARGADKAALQHELDELTTQMVARIERYVYGYDNDQFEAALGKLLLERGETVSTAESCTGGLIAHMITSIPGSSDYYPGSVVSYSNVAKAELLDVQQSTLDTYGAVSEQTVIEMLKGVCDKFHTNYGIAVSGIAGPGGGTEEKPVGTVWVAAGPPHDIQTRKYQWPGNREQNIKLSAVMAMELLRKYLCGYFDKEPKNR